MKAFALALCGVVLQGCIVGALTHGIKGSGKTTTVTRSVTGFDTIVNEGPAEVVVVVGKPFSVRVTIDDNLVQYLTTTVENGKLTISNTKSIDPTKCRIEISTPSLKAYAIEGAGDAEIKGIEGDSFTASIDGAGSVLLEGKANRADLSIEGAGDIKAFDLKALDVSASIDGAGDIEAYAEKNLNATVSGAGNVRYRGTPTVTKDVDGVGSVERE